MAVVAPSPTKIERLLIDSVPKRTHINATARKSAASESPSMMKLFAAPSEAARLLEPRVGEQEQDRRQSLPEDEQEEQAVRQRCTHTRRPRSTEGGCSSACRRAPSRATTSSRARRPARTAPRTRSTNALNWFRRRSNWTDRSPSIIQSLVNDSGHCPNSCSAATNVHTRPARASTSLTAFTRLGIRRQRPPAMAGTTMGTSICGINLPPDL